MAAALQEEMALVRQEAANAKAAQDRKKQAVAGRLLRDLIQDLKAIGITVDKKTGRRGMSPEYIQTVQREQLWSWISMGRPWPPSPLAPNTANLVKVCDVWRRG